MPQEDLLYTLAEVAVAFAGFAGLVTILSRREGQSAEQAELDFRNLQGVLGASLIVVAFSILPPSLAHMGLEPESAWRGASAAFCAAAGAYAARFVPGAVAGYRAAGRPVPWTLRVNIVMCAVVLLALIACSLALLSESFYLGALLAYLYFAGAAFVRVFVSLGRGVAA